MKHEEHITIFNQIKPHLLEGRCSNDYVSRPDPNYPFYLEIKNNPQSIIEKLAKESEKQGYVEFAQKLRKHREITSNYPHIVVSRDEIKQHGKEIVEFFDRNIAHIHEYGR